ncbi:MAG: HigA family addiction module antidote protein [Actinobacteria bacterium]|nr:HigA family addiction module antidote protein [Actinomycetota bacterium]
MAEALREFRPLYAVPPGETLQEFLDERDMSQSELARRMGRPFKTINEIINGKAAIMPETAIQLERVLGVPANFWTNLERQYREDQARVREVEVLERDSGWIELFPLRDLKRTGHLPDTRDKATLHHYLLRFLGVASKGAWEKVWTASEPLATFRQSPKLAASWESTVAWIRAGVLEASRVDARPFDKNRFLTFVRSARSMTRQDPEEFAGPLVTASRDCGVVVLFLRPFQGVRASGATHWTNPSRAVIQLSNRYKTDDHFWFSFFHEAAHVCLHGHKDVFIEEEDVRSATEQREREANEFASELLIPQDEWEEFKAGHPSTNTAVVQFAARMGVSPGIVVGRLQQERVWPRTQGNGLRRRFDLSEGLE